MIVYCGMIDSCAGTVIVSRTIRNSALRPRNRSFAKAKPARAHITACPPPITPAIMKLFSIDWANGTVEKTTPTMCAKLPPGTTRGGSWVAAALSVDATTNIQYSGKMLRDAAKPRMAYTHHGTRARRRRRGRVSGVARAATRWRSAVASAISVPPSVVSRARS